MKNFAVRASAFCAVLIFLLAGCADILSPPEVMKPETTKSGVIITVSDGTTGGAKTVLPDTKNFEFSKFELSFAGAGGATAPSVTMGQGETKTVELSGGDWTITAKGYMAASDGSAEVVVAEGSAEVKHTAGASTPVNIRVSMIMDKTKTGTLRVSIPADELEKFTAVSFKITEFPYNENQPVYNVNDKAQLQELVEGKTLNAGYYWVDASATGAEPDQNLIYRDIVHIYPYRETLLDFSHTAPPPAEQQFNVSLQWDKVGGAVTGLEGVFYEAGDTVTFTATPDDDKQAQVYVFTMNSAGRIDRIEHDENGDTGECSFVMPHENVNVYVKFFNPMDLFGIDVDNSSGGTVIITNNPSASGAKITEAQAGDEVFITATPAEGYIAESYHVRIMGMIFEAGGFENEDFPTASFTMPPEDVVVHVTFIPTGGSSTNGYNVTVNHPMQGGTIDANYKTNVQEGTTVTLTANPAPNYTIEVGNITVTGADPTQNVEVKRGTTGGIYTFTMPAYDVYVSATFIPDGGSTPNAPNVFYSIKGDVTFNSDGTYTVTRVYDNGDPSTTPPQIEERETGNWTGTETTRTLTPVSVMYDYEGEENRGLLNRDAFLDTFSTMVDMYEKFEPEGYAELFARYTEMGFQNAQEYVTWHVADVFRVRTYDTTITDDGILLMKEHLPQSIGGNELNIGTPYYGTTWVWNEDTMEAVEVKDDAEVYNFTAGGTFTYAFTDNAANYTGTAEGTYTYDAAHNIVYMLADSVDGADMQPYYDALLMLPYMTPSSAARQTNFVFSVQDKAYDNDAKLIKGFGDEYGSGSDSGGPQPPQPSGFEIKCQINNPGRGSVRGPQFADPGAEVVLEVQAFTGYYFLPDNSMAIVNTTGEPIYGTWQDVNSDATSGRYEFIMPEGPVVVEFEFLPIDPNNPPFEITR